jgi:hypothetical protein
MQGPPKAPVFFGADLAFCGKYAPEGTERHRNTNPTDQESDTEKAKPVKAGLGEIAGPLRSRLTRGIRRANLHQRLRETGSRAGA